MHSIQYAPEGIRVMIATTMITNAIAFKIFPDILTKRDTPTIASARLMKLVICGPNLYKIWLMNGILYKMSMTSPLSDSDYRCCELAVGVANGQSGV